MKLEIQVNAVNIYNFGETYYVRIGDYWWTLNKWGPAFSYKYVEEDQQIKRT